MKTGVLLLNLGSPDAPTAKALKPYLNALLGDPRVLDMPAPLRWLLLHGIILRTRPKHAAEMYSRIWTQDGSPFMVNSKAFANALGKKLGENFHVEIGMACGHPFISEGLEKLLSQPLRELVVFPLYPQYASATTGSAMESVFRVLGERMNIPAMRSIPAFFNHPSYLDAFTQLGKRHLETLRPDHVLFSYHGLPERQIRKAETTPEHCLTQNGSCCDQLDNKNANCYRAQCFATTRHLAKQLGLAQGSYSMSFQSRLGRIPWIQPYTEEMLVTLAKKGVRSLAVFTPSFVADCLETLEEIGLRGKETFIAAGGQRLDLIPSLNGEEIWVNAAKEILTNEH